LVSRRGSREDAGAEAGDRETALPGRGERVLVFAPHPDDELMGCGGLIQEAMARGAEVHVALMTNGDGAELALIFGERELPLKGEAFIALGRARQEESLAALSAIGLPADHVHFLGYPNNGLAALWRAQHWLRSQPFRSPYTRAASSPYERCFTRGAVYCGEQLLSDVIALLRELKPSAVYVTHPQDLHPDHWASCAFVDFALATLASGASTSLSLAPPRAQSRGGGEDWASGVRVYGYLIHWPHYPSPRRLAPSLPLPPPSDLAGERGSWVLLPLRPRVTERKLRAIRMYRSQRPSLDRLLLDFARANEAFELLSPAEAQEGKPLVWNDEESGRSHLGGAEMRQLWLEVERDLSVRAVLTRAPRKLKKGSYVAIDIRSWDQREAPVIMAVEVGPGDAAKGVRVKGDKVSSLPVAARSIGPGKLEIHGMNLGLAQEECKTFFVSSWGSVHDKTMDPAVISQVGLLSGGGQ